MKHEVQGLKPDNKSHEIDEKQNETNSGYQQQPLKNQEPADRGQQSGEETPFHSLPSAKMLRDWVGDHPLDAWDVRTIRYKLKQTFSASITEAAGGYVAQGRLQHAVRIKTEFMALLNLAQDFDKLCFQRVNEDDDALYFEHTRTRLKQAVYDLANLIDGCCPLTKQSEPSRLQQSRMHTEIQRTPPLRIAEIPAEKPTVHPKPPVEVLGKTDREILQTMSGNPKANMLRVDIEAASGYGRYAVTQGIKRLESMQLVCKTEGAGRNGWMITEKGVSLSTRLA